MRLSFLSSAVLVLSALLADAPPLAAEEGAVRRIGGDVFAAGGKVTVAAIAEDDDGYFVPDDVFAAGDRVALTGPATDRDAAMPPRVGGSVHLAGRRVAIGAEVAGDAYAAGFAVTASRAIHGDATLAGYDVTAGSVGGDLRAAGRWVTLAGPVGGYAALAGDRVTVDAPVAGDLALTAREVTFGPEARVGGRVILIADAGGPAVEVPLRVAPAARVETLTASEASARPDVPKPVAAPVGAGSGLAGTLVTLALLVALVSGVAIVLPERMARARTRLLARPWTALAIGAAAISALMGAVVLAASTVVGLVLVPVLVLAVPVAGLAGYVVGAHALGVRITAALGLTAPATVAAQARAAAAGVLVLALAGLVPLLGWIVLLSVSIAGLAMLLPPSVRPAAGA